MRLSTLADAFARLEESGRRLGAIDTLTRLFGAAAPRMLEGVRTDKAPADATTEREILEMFRIQRSAVSSRRRARKAGSARAAPSRG